MCLPSICSILCIGSSLHQHHSLQVATQQDLRTLPLHLTSWVARIIFNKGHDTFLMPVECEYLCILSSVYGNRAIRSMYTLNRCGFEAWRRVVICIARFFPPIAENSYCNAQLSCYNYAFEVSAAGPPTVVYCLLSADVAAYYQRPATRDLWSSIIKVDSSDCFAATVLCGVVIAHLLALGWVRERKRGGENVKIYWPQL